MWLKCTPVFKHGYGRPEYQYLGPHASQDWIDDAKHNMREEFGDPEGLREPKWEVLAVPPEDVLRQHLKDAEQRHLGAAKSMAMYADMLALHYPKEPTK